MLRCTQHLDQAREILRFAQDDNLGAQDDKTRTLRMTLGSQFSPD